MIHLVRHGESGWNAVGRVQGQAPDAPGLTPAGWRQAGRLAEELERELAGSRVRIVFSDLLRAVETARVLSARLGGEVSVDDRFRELDYGQLTGRLRSDRWEDTLVGARADAVWTDPDGFAPSGENVEQMTRRVVDALHEHLRDVADGECLIVVAHGGVLRAAQRLASHGSGAPQLRVPNASVFRLPTELLPVPTP